MEVDNDQGQNEEVVKAEAERQEREAAEARARDEAEAKEREERRQREIEARREHDREQQLSHLSPRARQKLEEEQQAGRDRLKMHQPAIAAADKDIKRLAQQQGRPVQIDGAEIVARRAAAERTARDVAEDAREASVQANAEKAVADHIESLTGTKGLPKSEDVREEAQELVGRKLEAQTESYTAEASPERAFVQTGAEGDAQNEAQAAAAQANAEKEVSERREAHGTAGESDDIMYDLDGDPVAHGQEGNYAPTPNAASVIDDERARNSTKGRKTRKERAPTDGAVGSGPSSE